MKVNLLGWALARKAHGAVRANRQRSCHQLRLQLSLKGLLRHRMPQQKQQAGVWGLRESCLVETFAAAESQRGQCPVSQPLGILPFILPPLVMNPLLSGLRASSAQVLPQLTLSPVEQDTRPGERSGWEGAARHLLTGACGYTAGRRNE
ncbi:uncharacterized protein LJ206_004823 [Theristicus caerulescens]